MATRRSGSSRGGRDERDEEQGRRPAGRRRQAPSMMPIVGIVVLIGGGLGIAGMLKGQKDNQPKQAPVVEESPFAHIADEIPPTRSGGGSRPARTYTEDSPEGLRSNATWVEATRIADEGMTLRSLALEARDNSDPGEAFKKNKEAQKKFDQALTMTGPWLDGLIEQYGETDRQVSKIRRMHNEWADLLISVKAK